ncbi:MULTISPECIES: response regulator transcription factor [Bacillus cereus group]|uniref:response regulator transcription factor n=1 Tax=Bacillus cereus group TaxID=86661 RepID=UPI000BECC021|nr:MULTISPECIES: response regulator transcription factor [Bacillus cereus group]PEC58904.1 DNA-binding response regulator [Bacillus wiedmannii]PEV02935.1 DNA-binding response regulator [Bacillus thuringiensis]PFZ67512.1 DNA-binding response regulator [Bacillus wiedmannii]PGB67254.1 DNA-binding response regulator [Bacillus wiedmannii]PGT54891.1 DNA-binding response regulator [Bacillus thuringiensis]
MEKIKIVLIESHEMFATGLKELLSKEKIFDVSIYKENSKELNNFIRFYNPDIVLMEEEYEFHNGFTFLSSITTRFPHIKVIMLVEQLFNESLELAYEYGAYALLETKNSYSCLLNCIKQVQLGYKIFPHLKNFDREKFLTSQEKSILQLMSEGKTNKDISKDLLISSRTVENHVSSILRKLDVSCRVGAVVKGIKRGLISI